MCIALSDCDSNDVSHPATSTPAADPTVSHVTPSIVDETIVIWLGSRLTRVRNSGLPVKIRRTARQRGKQWPHRRPLGQCPLHEAMPHR